MGDFIKAREDTENWDDYGCVYRSRQYSEFYAAARGAVKLNEKLPNLEIPRFDPWENTEAFLAPRYTDPDNLYAQFTPFPVQAFDVMTHRWFNAKIIKFDSMSAVITYEEWDRFCFKEKVSLISNQLVPANTYCIEDNKIGHIDLSNHSNNEFVEEYEAKQNRQRRFDEKFKLLNDEHYHKYFFEAVADNNLEIVQQLLSFGKAEEEKEEATKVKKSSKWTAFDWNESDEDEKSVEFSNMSDMEWLKWMNRT